MNAKQYAIERMEELLKNDEEQLEKYRQNLKIFRNESADFEEKIKETISNIAGLKDALHKLKEILAEGIAKEGAEK